MSHHASDDCKSHGDIDRHDFQRTGIRSGLLAHYLKKGAELLNAAVDNAVRFAYYHDGRYAPKIDETYWQVKAEGWARNEQVGILTPKNPDNPARAVLAIFEHPDRWRFDCSQFSQVINFYAWVRLLGSDKFNCRVRKSATGTIEIRPFQGSVFTKRREYYWRDSGAHPMKKYIYPRGTGEWAAVSPFTVDELLDAAPVGSRVGFRNDEGSDNFVAEQTVKVGDDKFLAHGLGAGPLSKNKVIRKLYAVGRTGSVSLAEARTKVWIRDIAYFM